MQLQTILNRVAKHRGFVYEKPRWSKDDPRSLEIPIRARKGSRGYCSGCGKRRPTYDHLAVRRFQYLPLWELTMFFAALPGNLWASGPGCRPITVNSGPWRGPRVQGSLAQALGGQARPGPADRARVRRVRG